MMTPPTEAEKRLARECAARVAEQTHPNLPEMAAKFRSGENDDYGMSVTAAVLAIRKTSEAAVKLVLQQQQDFLSPEYATGQPLSSFQERFACGQIAAALQSQEHLEKE